MRQIAMIKRVRPAGGIPEEAKHTPGDRVARRMSSGISVLQRIPKGIHVGVQRLRNLQHPRPRVGLGEDPDAREVASVRCSALAVVAERSARLSCNREG